MLPDATSAVTRRGSSAAPPPEEPGASAKDIGEAARPRVTEGPELLSPILGNAGFEPSPIKSLPEILQTPYPFG